jgi:hypothetical protein
MIFDETMTTMTTMFENFKKKVCHTIVGKIWVSLTYFPEPSCS